MLSDEQIDRYSRQILLAEIGGSGQSRLLASRVAVLGVGRLAAILANHLANAGVGELLTSPGLANEPLTNPDCHRQSTTTPLPDDLAAQLDLVVDTESPRAQLEQLVGLRLTARKPLLWCRAGGSSAVVALFIGRSGSTPCWTCTAKQLPRASDDRADSPLSAASTHWAAGITATTAIHALLGLDSPSSLLLQLDLDLANVETIRLQKSPDCETCARV